MIAAIYTFQQWLGILQDILRETIAIQVGCEHLVSPVVQVNTLGSPVECSLSHAMIHRVEETHDIAFSHVQIASCMLFPRIIQRIKCLRMGWHLSITSTSESIR